MKGYVRITGINPYCRFLILKKKLLGKKADCVLIVPLQLKSLNGLEKLFVSFLMI